MRNGLYRYIKGYGDMYIKKGFYIYVYGYIGMYNIMSRRGKSIMIYGCSYI